MGKACRRNPKIRLTRAATPRKKISLRCGIKQLAFAAWFVFGAADLARKDGFP
jgi:hypothetical protein